MILKELPCGVKAVMHVTLGPANKTSQLDEVLTDGCLAMKDMRKDYRSWIVSPCGGTSLFCSCNIANDTPV